MGPCACTGALWHYVIHLPVRTRDSLFLCVKKRFEAQISGILPDVFSYISHFVILRTTFVFDYYVGTLCASCV